MEYKDYIISLANTDVNTMNYASEKSKSSFKEGFVLGYLKAVKNLTTTQIRIVNNPKQDKNTPIDDMQYLGEYWNCSYHRYMNIQQWFEFIKKCEKKGSGFTIYLHNIEARKENILDGVDNNPREVITYWVNVDYKGNITKDETEHLLSAEANIRL